MPFFFSAVDYGPELRVLSGQISQVMLSLKTIGAHLMSGLSDLQTSVSNLQAAVSNETAASNAQLQIILNAVQVLQNPSSDDAAEEAASQSISAAVAAMQTSNQAMADAVAKLPPVSTIQPPPAGT